MWVDPEAGKTWEEIAEIVWRRLTPEMRTRCEALLAATGQTREEFCREARARFQERLAEALEDPDSELAQELDRFQFPLGKDPWLERTEPPGEPISG